ncbi:MAG TPA: hypothetical protein VEL79_11145, partial [Vicinamibacterales bacterium]|nr:hypothetical protein [Vicinamibacterales bacterium]
NAPLFHDGSWRLLDVGAAADATNDDLIACSWRRGNEMAVIAANITGHEAQGLVQIGDLTAADRFVLEDQLAPRSYPCTRADLANGLFVRLPSGDAHLFLVKAV